MGLLNFKKRTRGVVSASSVQTSSKSKHPYYQLATYSPMNSETRVYAQVREAIPIIDSAINKIVRLTQGFHIETDNQVLDNQINSFLNTVNVGGNQRGINAFISNYLNQLLTCGTAVGEIVLGTNGIYALYNSSLSEIQLKRAENGIDVEFYAGNEKVSNPSLILYSVLNPEPDGLCGTPLLKGLPFLADILMKIYNAIGQNWEHAGNVRYAVICKPSVDEDSQDAANRASAVADAWKDAMDSSRVKDFVAVGDVSVQVIGADNVCLNSDVPVRQLLEQIVAKTGLPPFMLGLSWSTTERMSTQQADILTTELESYRRILTPVITKITELYFALNGIATGFDVVWDDITLQDECDYAKARLYIAQAEKIERENT